MHFLTVIGEITHGMMRRFSLLAPAQSLLWGLGCVLHRVTREKVLELRQVNAFGRGVVPTHCLVGTRCSRLYNRGSTADALDNLLTLYSRTSSNNKIRLAAVHISPQHVKKKKRPQPIGSEHRLLYSTHSSILPTEKAGRRALRTVKQAVMRHRTIKLAFHYAFRCESEVFPPVV